MKKSDPAHISILSLFSFSVLFSVLLSLYLYLSVLVVVCRLRNVGLFFPPRLCSLCLLFIVV